MSPEAVTASKEMVGLFVEVPIELKTAIKTYCDTTGRSIRWVVERGVRQIIDVDAEQVPPMRARQDVPGAA